jgi:O-antigen/teichoic acid export membrane protein
VARLGERAVGAMYWNLLGKFVHMALRFLESVILVRLLGDSQYGMFAVVLNVNNIAVPVAALGLENTILRFVPQAILREGPAGERRLIWQALIVRTVVSAAAAAGIWLLAPWLAEVLLHDAAHTFWIKLVALMMVVMGFQNLLSRILVAHYEQKFINIVQAIVTALYLAAAATIVHFGGGVGEVLGCVVAMYGALAALFLWRWLRAAPPPVEMTGQGERPSIWRVIRFSGFAYVYSLLHFVFEKPMDVLLIGLLIADPSQVAWYVIAYNFVFQSVSVFAYAFNQGISLAIISEVAAQKDFDKLRRIFALGMEYLYLFILPVFVGGIVLGADILNLMYPADTAAHAFWPMVVLLVTLSFGKMNALTADFLQGLDMEKQLVKGRLVFGGVNLVLDVIFILLWGALGAAIATGLAVATSIAYEWSMVHRVLTPSYPWRFLGKVSGASVVMGGAILFAKSYLPPSLFVRVPVLLALGVAVFTLVLIALRPFRLEHADLLEKLPLPGKRFWMRLLLPRGPRAIS